MLYTDIPGERCFILHFFIQHVQVVHLHANDPPPHLAPPALVVGRPINSSVETGAVQCDSLFNGFGVKTLERIQKEAGRLSTVKPCGKYLKTSSLLSLGIEFVLDLSPSKLGNPPSRRADPGAGAVVPPERQIPSRGSW